MKNASMIQVGGRYCESLRRQVEGDVRTPSAGPDVYCFPGMEKRCDLDLDMLLVGPQWVLLNITIGVRLFRKKTCGCSGKLMTLTRV